MLIFPSMSPATISPLATDSEVRGALQSIVLRGLCMFVLLYRDRLLFRIFSKCPSTSHRSTLTELHPLVVARIPGLTQTREVVASIVLTVTLGWRGGGVLTADKVSKSQTWEEKYVKNVYHSSGNFWC